MQPEKVGKLQDECVSSGWFPLLCEVISCGMIPHYRAVAKRVLKRLCGGNRAIYQSVRDHYFFAFQFQNLLQEAQPPLQASLNIKEQARQCGLQWRTGGKASFRELSAGGLIGTNDLISEDCVTAARSKKIGAILDELEDAAKSRSGNWRNFCTLTNILPSQQAKQKVASLNAGLGSEEVDPNRPDGSSNSLLGMDRKCSFW